MEKHFNWTDKYTFGMSFSGTYSSQPTFNLVQDSKTLILNRFRNRKFVASGIKNVFHLADNLQIRIKGYSILSAEKLVGEEGSSAHMLKTIHGHFVKLPELYIKI